MHAARTFLDDLALVLCVAALVTLVFQRLRQPVILGYLLAGVIVGPHLPLPIFADRERIQTLSELGVVLVMFSIGLEFRLSRLVKLLPTAGITGSVQITAMLWLGYTIGRLFGWGWQESLFAGAMIAISSTMIVARVFAEKKVERSLQDIVFGVLIVQDLAAILLIAVLTAVATGAGLPAGDVAMVAGRLAVFLIGCVLVGMLVVPRLMREAHRRHTHETLLLTAAGLSFGLALLSEYAGYSIALGAFVAGLLVAESGLQRDVEHLVKPLRDLFSAVFFVSVGMMVDPAAVLEHGPVVVALTLAVLIGQPLFISLGAFLTGSGMHTSVRAGMSLAQIGEFSFIITSVGVTHGALPQSFHAIAVAVAAITAFATPWLVKLSGPLALGLEKHLPAPLQTFASLYTSWLETLRTRRQERRLKPVRRLALRLCLDAACILAVVIATSLGRPWLMRLLAERVGLPGPLAGSLIMGGAALLAVPFVLGVLRCSRKLGTLLARTALPPRQGVDLAAAPRRAFVLALELGIVLIAGLPLLALTQPFLPLFYGAGILLALLAVVGVGLWRSTTNLEGHVRAGAEVVIAALKRQSSPDRPMAATTLEEILPGLGPLTPLRLEANSPAVGKTLARLNLRGLTGAHVIAIVRGQSGVVTPTGQDTLCAHDVLVMSGSYAAVEAARELLLVPGTTPGTHEQPTPAPAPTGTGTG